MLLLFLVGASVPAARGGHAGRPDRNVARRPVTPEPGATIDEDDESVLVVLLLGVADDQEGPW